MAVRITRVCLGMAMVLVFASVFIRPSYGLRKLVGGKSQVPNVESNIQLQELGRYCVEEYNLKQQQGKGSSSGGEEEVFNPLMFSRVVEAERQVVSGIKYFLKIEVTLPDSTTRMFNSVVVLKPWLHSRELLDFSPITNPIF